MKNSALGSSAESTCLALKSEMAQLSNCSEFHVEAQKTGITRPPLEPFCSASTFSTESVDSGRLQQDKEISPLLTDEPSQD